MAHNTETLLEVISEEPKYSALHRQPLKTRLINKVLVSLYKQRGHNLHQKHRCMHLLILRGESTSGSDAIFTQEMCELDGSS